MGTYGGGYVYSIKREKTIIINDAKGVKIILSYMQLNRATKDT